jgi:zinc transport system permease protein
MFELFHYQFIQRAVIAGCFIAILCSTLGVFLVLKRLSLIGDGLAHVTFGSVAIGILFRSQPLYAAIPLVMLSSLGILRLTERTQIYGDTAIGIVSSLGIAIGIILVSISGGYNVDLFSYLFGSILSISYAEVVTSIVLSIIVIFAVSLLYNDLVSITFDEECARISGIRTRRINEVLVLLTAMTVVLAMKIVGIMLVSALLILPSTTALQIAKSFKSTMLLAAAVSVFSVISGIWISFVSDLPTGGTIIIINFIVFMAVLGGKAMIAPKQNLLQNSQADTLAKKV